MMKQLAAIDCDRLIITGPGEREGEVLKYIWPNTPENRERLAEILKQTIDRGYSVRFTNQKLAKKMLVDFFLID